nr:hypothetical protein [Tanacetum cinerariifolium]
MNQNFYNSNSSGFDQTQPPQFPVVHPPPQETSIKMSHDQENIINSMQTFLRKFNRYSFFKTPKVLLLDWDRVSEIKDAFENKQNKPEDIQELFRKLLDNLKNIHEELAEFINSPGWNRPADPDNSLSMGDEHLDTIPATESDEVIKSSVKDLVPILSEFKGISATMCDVYLVNNPTPLEAKYHFEIVVNSNDDYSSSDDDSLYYENIEYVEASPHDSEFVSLEVEKIVIPKDEEIEDDNLREKLLKVNLLISKIKALKDNPTPSSKFLTKSSSTSPKSVLEETNTFHNSLPEFENFCFDLEGISSGSTTTHSVISLPKYEAFSFYDDHIEEISSGSTTTHSDISLPEYDTFIFDLSIHQFPPSDRSDLTHEEFGDELAHIISPPEYDCFYFRNLPNPGELISSLNSRIRENLSSTTRVNLPVEDDYFPILAYVVWIFLAYLTYPVIPPRLHSFGNEDTIFDPGITINRFYSFNPGLSHRCRTFKKFNTHHVARGHDGDGGGDDCPPPGQIPTGCQGKNFWIFAREPENPTGETGKPEDSIPAGKPGTSDWEKQIAFWLDPKNLARAAQYAQNRAKSTVIRRQGSRSLDVLRDMQMESSTTREYPSLIQTYFDTHTVDGVFLRDEEQLLYVSIVSKHPL